MTKNIFKLGVCVLLFLTSLSSTSHANQGFLKGCLQRFVGQRFELIKPIGTIPRKQSFLLGEVWSKAYEGLRYNNLKIIRRGLFKAIHGSHHLAEDNLVPRSGSLYRGMVLEVEKAKELWREGLKSSDSGGEIWFTPNENFALDYALDRGTENRFTIAGRRGQDLKQRFVFVIFRIDRNSIPEKPFPNPRLDNAYGYREDIPPEYLTHMMIINPSAGLEPQDAVNVISR